MNTFEFTNIDPIQSIGDSLTDINLNYLNLDKWTTSIQTSADLYWKPMIELFTQKQNSWSEGVTLLHQNSAAWVDLATTVENNSAKWLQPLTLFYPQIFSTEYAIQSARAIYSTLQEWLNTRFAVLQENSDTPQYIENQEAMVWYYTNYTEKSVSNTYGLNDSTTCVTMDKDVISNCITKFHGYAYCSNGDMNCEDQTMGMDVSTHVECYFNTPPLAPYVLLDKTDNTRATASITNNLTVNFNDIKESNIISGFKFKVKDCSWIPVGVMTPVPTMATSYAADIVSEVSNSFYTNWRTYLETLTGFLPQGDKVGWIVPQTVTKIKIVASGSGGEGGDSAKPDKTTDANKGGTVKYSTGYCRGENGTAAKLGKPLTAGGLGHPAYGGTGNAGGGGAGNEASTSALPNYGGSGGGSGGWCSKVLAVKPGQKFTYTTGLGGYSSTISTDGTKDGGMWFMTAHPGGKGGNGAYTTNALVSPIIKPGAAGFCTGDFDNALSGIPGALATDANGAPGAMGYGPFGAQDLVAYGGYIYIEVLETVGGITI